MNIYGMYFANGKKVGFWIQRDSWGSTCAKVLAVGPIKGPPPYYGDPTVIADLYDLPTGTIKDKNVEISCPGNYTYRQIPPPKWSGEDQEDPRKGKILLNVPYEKKEQAKLFGAKWSAPLKSWWIPEGDDSAIEAARENGFLSNRAYKKLTGARKP